MPNSLDALRRLASLNWPVVIVTNQSAIGRGLTTRETVDDIHVRMTQMILAAGGRVDCVLYCPHRPEDDCTCRKPRPGLLQMAAQRLPIDLNRSFLVGDAESDIRAAVAVGCRPIFVKTGRGQEHLRLLTEELRRNLIIAEDLGQAVDWIINESGLSIEATQAQQPGVDIADQN